MNDQKQLISIFVENWTSVYNTILGRDVQITIQSVEKKNKSEVNSSLGSFQSYVSLSYGDDSSRHIVVALRNKLVSIISNLMIGLDTFKDEITADDKDAFEEAVNQMFSACQVPLKETIGLDMKFRDISFIDPGDASSILTGNDFKIWSCSIDLKDVAVENFILVTPKDFGVVEEERIEEIAVEAPRDTHHGGAPSPTAFIPQTQMPQEYASYDGSNISLLMDVELPITVRIGSTQMRLIDIMRLGLGSIIELEKLVDDPVEVLVNEKLVAKGEVVVCDSNFAVRVTEVESRAERIKSLA